MNFERIEKSGAHTHASHSHALYLHMFTTIAQMNLGEKTKNGVMDVFFSCYLHLLLSRSPTKRLTWNMLQFFMNYYCFSSPSCLLLVYSGCWSEHPFTLNHWRVYLLSCFVVIFVCPLRAIHRNYNEQINPLFFPSFVVIVNSVNGKTKLSLFFFKRF